MTFGTLKHIIAIFLLVIFTFNLGGSYLLFKLQQYQVRREIVHSIKKGVPDSELTTIAVSPQNQHELDWKNDEEFRYNHMMYDVVHAEKINENTTVYYCLSDAQEQQLIAEYTKDQQKNNQHKKRRSNTAKVFKFLPRINLLPQKEESFVFQKNQKNVFFYTETRYQRWLEVSSPPPKQVL
ncbi:hypothetical protein [Rasiella sp. SM2506]|uniref:hypothetical protein n=1 Tax=Rasiella sp. SM2506 TaxID=3423914 RepID=UPI003D793708